HICRPPLSTLFPYTTLFRSMQAALLRRPAGGDGEEMFGNVLLIGIVVLMFVLLVPVGIAVYQRLRVKPQERSERPQQRRAPAPADRKSTRLNSSHLGISYAV